MTAVQREPEPSGVDVLSLRRGGPTVQRIMLGTRLRRLRESLDISREKAASAIRASDAKLCRMELGRVGFKQRDIADLLTLYGVQDPAVRQEFLDSVRRANEPGWWRAYGDAFPSWFEQHLGLEEAASLIRTYEVQFIPGLLQTPEYAEAVIRLGHPITSPDAIARRVELRMTRQELLSRPRPPGEVHRQVLQRLLPRVPGGGLHLEVAHRRLGAPGGVVVGHVHRQDDVAHLQHVAVLQPSLDLPDPDAVEERAVRAAEVADRPALLGAEHLRVAAADGGVFDADFGAGRAADGEEPVGLPDLGLQVGADASQANGRGCQGEPPRARFV